MATESLFPTGQVTWTNLTGSYLYVDDDPDDPTGDWADTTSQGDDTVCHVSFDTPSGTLTTGANLQTFKAWIRKSRNNTPQCRIDVYEGGVLKASGTLANVNSLTGEMKTFTWDASVLTDGSGAGVECYIFGDGNSGAPRSATSSVEVDAVEWTVDYTPAGPTPNSFNKILYTSEPPTPNAWNQIKQEAGTGWKKLLYT